MNLLDPLTGCEPLTRNGVPECFGFVRDFWGWGFSALHNTYLRGYFAEYLIYRELLKVRSDVFQVPESHFSTKMEGDVHDLVFFLNDDKFTIQVKSKDSWSASEMYKTSLTQGFDPATGQIIKQADHWSDLYVFSYLNLDKRSCELIDRLHMEWNRAPHLAKDVDKQSYKAAQDGLVRSVLEVGNWTFFVTRRSGLAGRKEISLSELRRQVASKETIETCLAQLPFILHWMAAELGAERSLADRA